MTAKSYLVAELLSDHKKTGVAQIKYDSNYDEEKYLVMPIARLHRKTFCYSKSVEMLEASIRLLTYYLKHWTLPVF